MKSSNNPPTYPSAQPLPESRPISFFEQISGSMEFTKICDSSIPSIPIPNKIKILVTDSIPGTAHQILIAPKTYKTEKKRSTSFENHQCQIWHPILDQVLQA